WAIGVAEERPGRRTSAHKREQRAVELAQLPRDAVEAVLASCQPEVVEVGGYETRERDEHARSDRGDCPPVHEQAVRGDRSIPSPRYRLLRWAGELGRPPPPAPDRDDGRGQLDARSRGGAAPRLREGRRRAWCGYLLRLP